MKYESVHGYSVARRSAGSIPGISPSLRCGWLPCRPGLSRDMPRLPETDSKGPPSLVRVNCTPHLHLFFTCGKSFPKILLPTLFIGVHQKGMALIEVPSIATIWAAIILILAIRFSVKLYSARRAIYEYRSQGLVYRASRESRCEVQSANSLEADASMEPSLRTSILLLPDHIKATKGCASELSSRYDPANLAGSWSNILLGYLAVRPTNAGCGIHSWVAPNYAGTFPSEISCYEIFPKAHFRGVGYRHDGRGLVENVEGHLQSWV